MDNRKWAIASRILTAIPAGAFSEVLPSILPDDVCSERRIRRHFESGILCSRKPTYFITRKNRKNMASLGRGRLHLPEVRLRRGYRRQKGPGRDGSPAQVDRHGDRNANAGRRLRGPPLVIRAAPVGYRNRLRRGRTANHRPTKFPFLKISLDRQRSVVYNVCQTMIAYGVERIGETRENANLNPIPYALVFLCGYEQVLKKQSVRQAKLVQSSRF